MSNPGGRHLPPRDVRPGRARTGWQRFVRSLSWVAVTTAALVVFGAVGGYAYVQYLDGNITRVDAFSTLNQSERPVETTNATNFLLAGSDTRVGQDPGFQGTGDETVSGQRSDSVLLVHLSARDGDVTVLSFPRDSYVMIPAYTDPKTKQVYGKHLDKLNAAFSIGGPTLLIQTIESLSGLRIDHFVDVDFSQFKDIVNSLGGIEVCLTKAAYETNSGIDLPAGKQTINGDQALSFVRQRYGLPAGDLDRINRQQRFLSSVIRKLTSTGVLLDPVKLNSFLTSVSHSITVDRDTSLDDLLQLGQRLQGLQAGGVKFLTLPTKEQGLTTAAGDVLVVDPVAATALFQKLYDDAQIGAAVTPSPAPSASASPTPSGPALTVPPGSVTVTVENDSGVEGRAVTALGDLSAVGFRNGSAQNGVAGLTATEVHFPASLAESAATVAAALPGAVLVPDSNLQGVLVKVGSDYSGTQAFTVAGVEYGAAAPATPAPLATSTTAPLTAATADCGV